MEGSNRPQRTCFWLFCKQRVASSNLVIGSPLGNSLGNSCHKKDRPAKWRGGLQTVAIVTVVLTLLWCAISLAGILDGGG